MKTSPRPVFVSPINREAVLFLFLDRPQHVFFGFFGVIAQTAYRLQSNPDRWMLQPTLALQRAQRCQVWCQAVRKDFNPPTILEILALRHQRQRRCSARVAVTRGETRCVAGANPKSSCPSRVEAQIEQGCAQRGTWGHSVVAESSQIQRAPCCHS